MARLTREDWIAAGFRALVRGGHVALRVEPVARDVGATKGSFYWHFADPSDWHLGMLTHWSERALINVITAMDALPPGEARLRGVIDWATTARDPLDGGVLAEPALRDWARYDARVAEAVCKVDQARIDWLVDELTTVGCPANAARPFYAALIGLVALQLSDDHTRVDLNLLLDALLHTLAPVGASGL
ncbi:MAG: TetR/AcrR family transcriptional regulator [Deltaproteobacteria bacterium]